MRLAILFLSAQLACQGATYYVDSARGSDSNPGVSQRSPWKTIEKVNAFPFQPGDRVLLHSGSVWRGQLAPKSSGAERAPIVIDRYGSGPRPRIDAGGLVEDAVLLHNIRHVEVRNLEVTNHGAASAARRGVHISLENFGTAAHIVVSGLYIHDVNGDNSKKDNGGIIFRTNGSRTPTRFDGLTIERNIVWKVDRSAIAAQSNHYPRGRWFPSLHVVIRDNYVDDVGGDGIVPWVTDGVLVEHNIARNCNRRAASYNAGIWPWSTDNSLFQLNEAFETRTTRDGQGFDSDYNSRNTLFQYNYSHDNEGGFLLICTPVERNAADNIGNDGTVIRYNISRNDRSRIFHLSGADHTTIHDNAIYVGPGLDVQMFLVTDWNGWSTGTIFRGNTFRVEGTARYGHSSTRAEDGTYTLAPGWGGAKEIEFRGNQYAGQHLGKPEDPESREASPPVRIDWNAPRFDPGAPDTFDAFLKKHRAWMLRLFERQFQRPVKLTR